MKKQAITLGRIGVLLPIASIIPFLGSLAGLAALALLVISHYYFAKVYEKNDIFNNALTGTLVPVGSNLIGGAMIGVAVVAALLVFAGEDVEFDEIEEITALILQSSMAIAGGVIILAGLIVGFYFLYKALSSLATETGINLFKTAGLLYFIGAIAMVIFIGALVILAAWILHIIAYFSIPTENEKMTP